MKLYRECAHASISMDTGPELRNLLNATFLNWRPEVIIETGTYEGLGSTRMLAEILQEYVPLKFYTCEVNWLNHCRARKNLSVFPFVTCLWGRSVSLAKSIAAIESDDMIRNHERYPDIFIDSIDDPVKFYADECRGHLHNNVPRSVFARIKYRLDLLLRWQGEDLLAMLIQQHHDNRLFLVLDSAGGIGRLEYSTAESLLRDREYYLLLDDIHHVKHYGSFLAIQKNPSFRVIGQDWQKGWALVHHHIG